MVRIVVLGTKPNAVIPDGDAIYCANAAIGFYKNEVARYTYVVNVASTLVLNKHFENRRQIDVDLYHDKWTAVSNASPQKLVLVDAAGQPELSGQLVAKLRESGYNAAIEILSLAKRTRLVRSVAGMPYPIVTRELFSQALQTQLEDIVHLCKYWLQQVDGDVKGKFRPSTGIMALLYAIDCHGSDAEYVLAGIGVQERQLHQHNHALLHSEKIHRTHVLAPHIEADIAVLRSLGSRYRVATTEPELSPYVSMLISDSLN